MVPHVPVHRDYSCLHQSLLAHCLPCFHYYHPVRAVVEIVVEVVHLLLPAKKKKLPTRLPSMDFVVVVIVAVIVAVAAKGEKRTM